MDNIKFPLKIVFIINNFCRVLSMHGNKVSTTADMYLEINFLERETKISDALCISEPYTRKY